MMDSVAGDNKIHLDLSPATADDLKKSSKGFFQLANNAYILKQANQNIPICQNIAYAAEFLLKSCIVKKFQWNAWPSDFRECSGLKSHNLAILLEYLGYKTIIIEEMKKNSQIGIAYGVLNQWRPDYRYCNDRIGRRFARDMLISFKVIEEWLNKEFG